MKKKLAKFQNDSRKTVGGVTHTRPILSSGMGWGRSHGKPNSIPLSVLRKSSGLLVNTYGYDTGAQKFHL